MAEVISVLVTTATPGFGELIQMTLEETGLYKVLLVDTAAEALECAQTMKFALAILDHVLPDNSLLELIAELKEALPLLRLIVIPPKNDPTDPLLAQSGAHGYLTKPFYLPDLLDTVAEVLHKQTTPWEPTLPAGAPPAPAQAAPVQPLDWLQDVSRAAQHLTRLSLETSAQAALIVRDGQLWAYAGQLAQPAAQELTGAIVNFWATDRITQPSPTGDMVRLVRLEVTSAEYMLYATALGKGMILALAFNAETPFSKIRTQASYLARALAAPPDAGPAPRRGDAAIPLSQLPPVPDIRPLLGDVPPPTPDRPSQAPASRPRPAYHPPATTHPEPASPIQAAPISSQPAPQVSLDTLSNAAPPQAKAQPAAPRPAALEAQDESLELHPITPGLHNLAYACLLIPRLPQHHLTGDLGSRLNDWIPQLCLAYGWRLTT
jgi:DNA-binding response OmpR family regulator